MSIKNSLDGGNIGCPRLPILLVILSLADGLFTLHLIQHGATEENPLMAYFLGRGPWPFMTAKFLLTVIYLAFLGAIYFFVWTDRGFG
jgi:Domain of unknown function (DUF5658)